ncbi:cupin domain-containing protein [Kutzneria chonburiensis]|uniref:Cupin domain-containing protein n=1 Tax=Kutzneria chonburiensis TaxID=1483604 RepID=A0ABV6MN69_9PSEU|nr:cupin domain-containing protein [Kutzneria chonburiensis]
MTDTSRAVTVVTDPDTQAAVNFLGAVVRARIGAEDTAGRFAVLEHAGERGYMSPLHLHEADEETFLVLDGELRVEVGSEAHAVGAGGLALLPRGLPHGFVVVSGSARFLTLHTPAGFDRFVAEVGTPLNVPADVPAPAELTRIAARHGIQIVGPPLLP